MKRETEEFVQVGNYAAKVAIVVEDDGDWSPRLSLKDAQRLETVRLALQRGDLAEAAKHARIFELLPVSA
jgi:hypothetical protein